MKHNMVMEITIAWKLRKPSSTPASQSADRSACRISSVSETVPLRDTYRFHKKMETCIVLYSLNQILSRLMMYQEDRLTCTVS